MDGVELVSRLRHGGRTSDLPIVVLTECGWMNERERAERAGCDAFLPKPCLPDELLRHVRQLLAASTLRQVRGTPISARLPNESREYLRIAGGLDRSA
jgi:two-component system cell cycle response regulator DivK